MAKSHRLILGLAFALFLCESLVAKTREVRELKLGTKQASALAKDGPALAFSLSSDGKKGAILGQKFVWLWDFERQLLSKLTGLSSTEGMTHILLLDNQAVAVAGPRRLQIIDAETETANIIWDTEKTGGTTINLERNGNTLVWLHTDGVFKLDLSTGKVQRIFGSGLFQNDDIAVLGESDDELWILRDFRLLRKTISAQKVQSTLIHKGTQPLRSLAVVNGEIWAANLNTIVRFGLDGKFIAAIPVEGARQLLKMDIHPQRHSYLFTDGLFEVFNLPTKEHSQYRLPIELRQRVTGMTLSGPVLGVMSKNEARFFLAL